ncbi:P-loop NTPase family protein [Natronomonas moolapensis]|uniref:hypothetical protein n=1 Tax=Natronomonas moolapensis TaxID=416273 RepID=UPI0006780A8B|nr:hypothetical protein [Natronomonas moolapensis]
MTTAGQTWARIPSGTPGVDVGLCGGVIGGQTTLVSGDPVATDEGISYLADNIVFLRYVGSDGGIREPIGVLKKRFGDFERTVRELSITSEGVVLGEKTTGLRGALTGIPGRTAADD